jgi:hypothetical protein
MASKLEEVAIAQRNILIAKNTYNVIPEQNYSPTHSRALSDNETPLRGKGTGIFLDTFNGGDDIDVNGNPNFAGSGRLQNQAVNVYNKDNPYDHPDTTGNVGQVVIV